MTHSADVEVNSVSQPLVHSPDSDAIGSESSSAPTPISAANTAGTIHGRGRKRRRRGERDAHRLGALSATPNDDVAGEPLTESLHPSLA